MENLVNNPKIRIELNRNFIIRYKDVDDKKTSLIGAGRYHYLVGEDLANKHFTKALNSTGERCIFNLRRGLKIEFVRK